MAMTASEAKQFIEEAERLPIEQVDTEKLAEALKVLQKSESVNLKPAIDFLVEMGKDAQRTGEQIEEGGSGVAEALQNMVEWLGKILPDDPSKQNLDPSDRQNLDVAERAAKLAARVADQTPEVRERRFPSGSAVGAGGIVSGQPGAPGGIPGRPPAVADAGGRIPSDLLNRFYQAASRAGIDRAEAKAILTDLEQQASGGGPITVTNSDGTQTTMDPAQFGVEAPTIGELVGGQIATWMSGVIGDVPFALVSEEIRPATGGLERFRSEQGLPTPTRYADVAARYFGGDNNLLFAGRSPEQIVEIQKQLEQAGLIGEGTGGGAYYAGIWDASVDGAAMGQVMENANASGRTWEEQLDFMVANVPQSVKEERARQKAAEALEDTFIAPAYLKPDPASLNQTVKQAVRGQLGREPTDAEMAALAGAMSSAYRSEYEAEVAAMRAEFDAMRGYEDQIMADIAAGGTGEGIAPPGSVGTFQGVDPQARFMESFDQRFGPEMDFIEGQADTVRNADNVMASIMNMSRLVG